MKRWSRFAGILLTALGLLWLARPGTAGKPEADTLARELRLRMLTVEPFHFVTDYPFHNEAEPLAADLQALGQQLHAQLGVQLPTVPLRVYIFRDPQSYLRFLREYLPGYKDRDFQRTGLFLLRNGVPHIFALRTENLRASLRHEYVHVLLNLARPNVPLWLDEGLAVYQETADGTGRNARCQALLAAELRRGWRPDLARLSRLKTMPELTPRDYAEAWSWVDLLLQGTPQDREGLRGLLLGEPQPFVAPSLAAWLTHHSRRGI